MRKKNDLGYQVDWEFEPRPGEIFLWWSAVTLMGLIWLIGFYTTVIWVFEWVLG